VNREFLINDGERDHRVKGIKAVAAFTGYETTELYDHLGCDRAEFEYAIRAGVVEIGGFEVRAA